MEFSGKIRVVLIEIGLTEIQADFYLFLLKTGGNTVSRVAKALNINRTNSYTIVDRLRELDLVTEENKTSGKVIYAKSYEPILEALGRKEKSIENLKSTVNSLIPIFASFGLKSNYGGPKIRTYESKREFGYLLEDMLSNPFGTKEMLLFTNQSTEKGFFSKHSHEEFVQKRVKNGIKIRVLAVNNDEGGELMLNDAKLLRETRLLPENFDFNAEIYIYDNKVTMIDVKEDIIGVVIESDELVSIHKQLFEMMWNDTFNLKST
jgi:sugar-specific transcriptional regulator TrmB